MTFGFIFSALLWSFSHLGVLVLSTMLCFAWNVRWLGWIGIIATLCACVGTFFVMAMSFATLSEPFQQILHNRIVVLIVGSFGAALVLVGAALVISRRQNNGG